MSEKSKESKEINDIAEKPQEISTNENTNIVKNLNKSESKIDINKPMINEASMERKPISRTLSCDVFKEIPSEPSISSLKNQNLTNSKSLKIKSASVVDNDKLSICSLSQNFQSYKKLKPMMQLKPNVSTNSRLFSTTSKSSRYSIRSSRYYSICSQNNSDETFISCFGSPSDSKKSLGSNGSFKSLM